MIKMIDMLSSDDDKQFEILKYAAENGMYILSGEKDKIISKPIHFWRSVSKSLNKKKKFRHVQYSKAFVEWDKQNRKI